MIEKVLKTIAKHTIVDHITRMVRFGRGVHRCVRKSGETIKDYVHRFKTSALGFLNMVRASKDSTKRQIFDMDVHTNGKL